jgi:adenylylsulfate kinase-like enzyme
MGYLIWITGLAGVGKTTLATALCAELRKNYPKTVLIDGDEVREVMGEQHAVDMPGRLRNAMRIARLCHLLTKQGIDVICSTISLFHEVHEFNRSSNGERYVEVLIECSTDELQRRDKKGLYSGVAAGKTANVVGLDQPFDRPRKAHLVLRNERPSDLDENLRSVLHHVRQRLALT